MPMSTLEHDTLAQAFALCKQLVMDVQPKLAGLAQIYDSAGGVKATLTQAELDAVPELSGLTKTQVDNGLYVLTAILLPGLADGYPALAQLAARFL